MANDCNSEAIDAEFAEMATDAAYQEPYQEPYQEQAMVLEAEYARSGEEALQLVGQRF